MILQDNVLELFNSNDNIVDKYPSIYIKLNKYLVKDVFGDELRYLFILESPHKEEVLPQNKCPAAGETGVRLTKMIYNGLDEKNIMPLGKLINDYKKVNKYNIHYNGINKIGIMNVSSIPMQAVVYYDELQSDYKNLFNKFEIIRNNPYADTRDDIITKEIEKEMKKSFVNRLHDIMCKFKRITIIPCGHVARAFYKEYLILKDKKSINGVPHPGRATKWNKKIKETRKNIFDETNINLY